MSDLNSELKAESDFIANDMRQQYDKSIITALDNNNFEVVTDLLSSLHIADLAKFLDRLRKDQREKLIDLIRDDMNPMLLVEIGSTSTLEHIVKYLGSRNIAERISALEIDDAVSVLLSLDENLKASILFYLSAEKQKELEELLSYPVHSVGRIMQKKFVVVPEYWSVGQTFEYMRSRDDLPKEFYVIFIVDPKYTPIAYVTLGALMNHPQDCVIKDIMRTEMKVIDTNFDQGEMSYLFTHYGLISIPVVNKAGRLVGAITVDDAVEIIEKEAEKDLMLMGGLKETDLHLKLIDIVKRRFPWLLINLLTAIIAAFVIRSFEGTIQNIIFLAALMPIVASMGGNAGTQTMTISIVAIASKELTSLNSMRLVYKQILACLINGSFLATIGGILIYFWYGEVYLSLVFSCSIIVNFTLAGLFGSSIPILINKFGLDPAIVSPIFLTTLTDIFGFFTFLGLASVFLI